MEIPSGMSSDEVTSIILKVTQKLAPKYIFASYDVEDIEQEAFIIVLDALSRYDSDKTLENFLYTHINNRLKNFKRDNNYRQNHRPSQQIQNRKRNILKQIDTECQ